MVHITDDELSDLSAAAQRLWQLDENRLTPNVDYDINVQGRRVGGGQDTCVGKLFAGVKRAVWQRPTYLIFYHLLDNYVVETGVAEEVTAQERKEMRDFLDAIMHTKPMQYCHEYLVQKGQADPDIVAFKNQLYQMWFSFYRRDGAGNDSCGFEHVFVGESKGDNVSGFHNWVQFYIEEGRGKVDYRGYHRSRRGPDTTDDEERLISVELAWNGENKDVSTFFIGTSPEFEMALYTLCFCCGEESNRLVIDQYEVLIRAYRIRSKYGDKVGSVFPELLAELPTMR